MSMIHDGDTQYEDAGAPVLKVIDKVIAQHGNRVLAIGRWALVRDQVHVVFKTPKPPKPKAAKKSPPPRAGAVPQGESPEVEPEQAAESPGKPPHLVMLKWIKPPPSVQVLLQKGKMGTGLAHVLEVRSDLWSLVSERDREAAVMTKLLERAVVDGESGEVKVRKADLPIQTHPAVQAAYGPWWEHLDPATIVDPDEGEDLS